jgi:probable HAF family extracellular repeat protein
MQRFVQREGVEMRKLIVLLSLLFGVGSAVQAAADSWHGFVDTAGTFTKIDVPGAIFTRAYGISDAGKVVGYSLDGGLHGFLYAAGSFTTIDVPSANYTLAYGINNPGQIVGQYEDSSRRGHGFLDTSGSFTTIDVPGAMNTIAYGINDVGQIVGVFDSGGRPTRS